MSLQKIRALRDEIAARVGEPAPALQGYLAKVDARAHEITDEEVKALLDAGVDQDAIFEATLVRALDAALTRHAAGLDALAKAEAEANEP